MLNKLFGKKANIDAMQEKRPLPLGMTEFEEWSDRIISGTLLAATPDSQKFALADMLLHLKPTEDHMEDAYFIKSLRKYAVNQVADAKRMELREKAKARLAADDEEAKVNGQTKVLGNQVILSAAAGVVPKT